MSDEQSSNAVPQKSWLERIGQVLVGELKDRQELMVMLRDAQKQGLLDIEALLMIERVLQVSEMQARDVMLPRSQMVVIEDDSTLEQLLPIITESGHSRFPVIGENRDEVVGLLLAKDLLPYFIGDNRDDFVVRDLLRPAVFIPESKRLNVLLKDFRANRNHMAIVVDEYGGAAGLVTIEDVVEQIVGEISDEHDIDEDQLIKEQSEGRYTLKALTPIEEFNEYFQCDFRDACYDTVAGLVMQALGHLPKRDEEVTIGRFRIKVLSADSRRMHLLEVTLLVEEDQPPANVVNSSAQ